MYLLLLLVQQVIVALLVDAASSLTMPAASIRSSSVFRNYIESTDAFGMVYNSNYPQYLERALGSRLTSCKSMKFKVPARLGDELEFALTPSKKDPSLYSCDCLHMQTKQVHFTATGVGGSASVSTDSELPSEQQHSSVFDVYADEMDTGASCLQTRSVFNLFERARTDILQGPAALGQLDQNYGLHVYVARVSNYRHHHNHRLLLQHQNDSQSCCYKFEVMSSVSPITDAFFDFEQTIRHTAATTTTTTKTSPVASSDIKDYAFTIARATITCACVDSTSGAPKALPEDLKRILFGKQG